MCDRVRNNSSSQLRTSSIKEKKVFYFFTYEIENVARVLTPFFKIYSLYIFLQNLKSLKFFVMLIILELKLFYLHDLKTLQFALLQISFLQNCKCEASLYLQNLKYFKCIYFIYRIYNILNLFTLLKRIKNTGHRIKIKKSI